MRIPRIFTQRSLTQGHQVELEDAPSNHLLRVLRLRTGASLVLFDGRGGEYEATLDEPAGRRARVQVHRHVERDLESPVRVTLAQGVSRGERMDYAIQKAVELGVAEIVPLLTRRSVVRLDGERATKRQRRWRQVAIGACEQCGRNTVPTVHEPSPLEAWLERDAAHGMRLYMDPEGQALEPIDQPSDAITLLVGPEGGLAPGEIDQLRENGFRGVRLGPRILRTETAAIAMLAALQTLWGDFR